MDKISLINRQRYFYMGDEQVGTMQTLGAQHIKAKDFSSLSPYTARFGNVLFAYDILCSFDFFGKNARICPLFDKKLEECEVFLALRIGTSSWKIALEKQDIVLFHDAVKNVEELTYNFKEFLPEPVRKALLESVIKPIIVNLSEILGIDIQLESCEFIQDMKSMERDGVTSAFSHGLAFSFVLENDEHGSFYSNNFFIAIPEEKYSLDVLENLEKVLHDEAVQVQLQNEIMVPLGFCIGKTSLMVQDLKNFSEGDIVIVDDYYVRNSCMRVYPYFGFRQDMCLDFPYKEFLLCSMQGAKLLVAEWGRDDDLPNNDLQNNYLTVGQNGTKDEDSMLNNQEERQEQSEFVENSGENPAVSQEGTMQTHINDLAVMLHFELDKRVVTLQELQLIKAGYTFALDTDMFSPVSLVVNGKNIGKGKIVDINGILGVQVTNIVK